MVARGGILVNRSAEEFRRLADECHRLSRRLKHPEHRSFARDLANAWTELAERAEAKHAAAKPREVVLVIVAAEPEPSAW
jgi:hypothetical protein